GRLPRARRCRVRSIHRGNEYVWPWYGRSVGPPRRGPVAVRQPAAAAGAVAGEGAGGVPPRGQGLLGRPGKPELGCPLTGRGPDEGGRERLVFPRAARARGRRTRRDGPGRGGIFPVRAGTGLL